MPLFNKEHFSKKKFTIQISLNCTEIDILENEPQKTLTASKTKGNTQNYLNSDKKDFTKFHNLTFFFLLHTYKIEKGRKTE